MKNKINGVHSWLVVMMTIFSLLLMVDNYVSFGIVVQPVQILIKFIQFLTGEWWYFGLICICCLIQIIFLYVIEKSLILGLLSENVGMILHAINAFSAGILCSVTFYTFSFNPMAAEVCIWYIFLTFPKTWSFAYVNMSIRKRQRTKTDNEQHTDVEIEKYLSRITFINVLSYMILTPAVEYHPHHKIHKRNITVLLHGIIKALVIMYTVTIIFYQYIQPELEKSPLNSPQTCYLDIVCCVLKIALPVNLVWLLYFSELFFNTYLYTFVEITGMSESIILQKDWCNAKNMNDFWTKWNIPMYNFFKNSVYIPLLQMGYSKNITMLIVAVLSGLLHEFTLSFPCRIYNGVVFVCTLLEIPAGYTSAAAGTRFGEKCGNLLLWFYLIVCHSVTFVIMYNSFVKVS